MFKRWAGILLRATAYRALGGWFTGITYVSSYFTHQLASSFLEGCNVLTAAVSTPSNEFGHSLLAAWGPEAAGSLTRWFCLGGLWLFVALHGALLSNLGSCEPRRVAIQWWAVPAYRLPFHRYLLLHGSGVGAFIPTWNAPMDCCIFLDASYRVFRS